METERWQKIDRLYHAALEVHETERANFIERACGGDESLLQEVRSLLAHEEGLGTFLEKPVMEAATGSVAAASPARQTPEVGRYHLLQKVGEGGMGEVWLAEQKEPVRRRVAVKLVREGMNTREVMARFESERQALALMDHPTIAKVFDAGSTPEGGPYFVMEYVAGIPITAYCDNHRLSTRARLELFMRVCEGVQHAHQKAILHRDLKPSNILVTEADGQAVPKIIDFGVAKALSQKLTTDTLVTRVGALVGTPEYMSPEQALSSGEDIDTRTDVYSLGIILYELLAGVPPLELRKIAFEELLRRLREEDPPKPSTKIRTQAPATATEVARKRQTEPLALAKQIRGDLDSIALKALEKVRSRRYGSASELAADIGRYMRNEAVLAVPHSAAYRARKFARRHRTALVISGAFLVVLVVAITVSTRQSIRANREAAVTQAINDFLRNDLLAKANIADFRVSPDPHLEVRTVLDRAAAGIAGKFQRQPEVESAIRDTIGETYINLSQFPEARSQLERALELHRRLLGTENPKTLRTMSLLGAIDLGERRDDEAETILGQTLGIQRRVLGQEHLDTLTSMGLLASVYEVQGKFAQAEALDQQVMEISRHALGMEHWATIGSIWELARLYTEEDKYANAEPLAVEVLQISRRIGGSEARMTLECTKTLAEIYIHQGEYAKAEPLSRQAMEIWRRVLGQENGRTREAMYLLADSYAGEGRYAEAEALMRKARKAEVDPEQMIVTHVFDFEFLYQQQGKVTSAETYASQTLAKLRNLMHQENWFTMRAATDLALAYVSQGKFAKAEVLTREATEFYRKNNADNWRRFRAESLLGACLAGQKKYAEAEPLLLAGYQGMRERKDKMGAPDRYHLERAHEWLVHLYRAWGKPDKAAEWAKE